VVRGPQLETPAILAPGARFARPKEASDLRDFSDLYGESLHAMERGELVAARIPESFGPRD
jgi:hypothetical protein